jgi:hypothetical protein
MAQSGLVTSNFALTRPCPGTLPDPPEERSLLRPRKKFVALLAVATTTVILLAGCSADADWTKPHPAPMPVGALRDGFLPSSSPSPQATIEPKADSWVDVNPSAGYRVVLLTAGRDAPTLTLVSAVREWAEAEDVDLRTVTADENHIDGIVEAMELNPDLIVSAGGDLVDALSLVTASHLDQNFLVVGAALAEPTYNVTAVDWTGAAGGTSALEPDSYTPERSESAVRAGVASILHDQTGVVLWLD